MKQHEDHRNAAAALRDKATAAGLTDLAATVQRHIDVAVRASAAHGTGDVLKQSAASAALMRSAADVLDHVGEAAGHPDVIAAARNCGHALTDAFKASI